MTTLYCDNILAAPIDRDWSEGYCETWVIVPPDFNEMEAEQLFDFADDYGRSLPADPRQLSREEIIKGLESLGIACYDDEEPALLAAAYGDAMMTRYMAGDANDWPEICREGHEESSAPMMNYAYPITLRGITPSEAALELIGLPLTLIHDEEEDAYFLALTGGGMDLSAEICRAYIALGQRPPVHFCRIPRMAWRKYSREFIDTLIASCEVSQNLAQRTINDLRAIAADPDYSEGAS